MERLEAIVRGRVQGVMYRDFAMRMARRRKLVGEASNLNDGTVRVIAEGERASLESFAEKLKSGPVFARVERVDASFFPARGGFKDFSIKHGRYDIS